MRAPVSIVIPTLNAGATLAPVLGALGEGLAGGLVRDLVVSDGGSKDATRMIAEDAGARWVNGPAGRGGQLARGAAAAGGDWLLFLHADTQLGPGWAGAVQAHMAQAPGRAGYFRLAFQATGAGARIVAGWGNMRARVFGLPFGDQGLLISRALYGAVGGFPEIPLMEDAAIARALRGRLAMLDATAHTGAGRYRENGWAGQGARNLWRQARFFAGVDSEKLASGYRAAQEDPSRRV